MGLTTVQRSSALPVIHAGLGLLKSVIDILIEVSTLLKFCSLIDVIFAAAATNSLCLTLRPRHVLFSRILDLCV